MVEKLDLVLYLDMDPPSFTEKGKGESGTDHAWEVSDI